MKRYVRFAISFDRNLIVPAARILGELSSIMRLCDMKLHHYDIVRQEQEDDTSAIWLEAVSDLNTAQCRIQELVSLWPGQFQAVDQQSHQIIARVNGLPNHGEPMVD
jgi:hypothetical protein